MIGLEDADFCVNCDVVFNGGRKKECPKCNSANGVVPLISWIPSSNRIFNGADVMQVDTETGLRMPVQ